jgi:hypothetical protein
LPVGSGVLHLSFAHFAHSVARRAYPESQMSHFFPVIAGRLA